MKACSRWRRPGSSWSARKTWVWAFACMPRRSRTPEQLASPPSSAAPALITLNTSPSADAAKMAAAGVVGVLLPTVTLSLRTFEFGQVRRLKEAGVRARPGHRLQPGHFMV